MSYLIYGIIILVLVAVSIFLGMFIYAAYIVLFQTKKEYIKYGDRYVVRFRDKKTGKFM